MNAVTSTPTALEASSNARGTPLGWAYGNDTEPLTLASLATARRWVAWQTESRESGKPTKVPYSPSGSRARADDARTWGTRQEATTRAVLLPMPFGTGGVGLELGDLGNGWSLGGIDLDSCCQPGSGIAPWARRVVELIGSYTETSPSGTGCKMFFAYCTDHLAPLRKRGLIDPGNGTNRKPTWGKQWKAGGGDHPPAIELHLGNRYFAVTDKRLPGSPPTLRLVALEDLESLFRIGADFKASASPLSQRKARKVGGDQSRSAVAFRKGTALIRAGKSIEEMMTTLRADPETAEWCREKGNANGQRELNRIWDRAKHASEAIEHVIEEFNRKYMVVNEAGHAVIYAPAEDLILHRRYFDRMGFSDLRALYMNRKVEVGRDGKDNPIMRPVAEVWLNHPERRQFIRGVTFDPSGAPIPDATLNLWRGFGVTPQAGSWERLRLHIRDVLCLGNREHYEYLIRWMARMVQQPAEQGETAIVMRGVEGTGKGTLARALKRILGQHALAISNAKHLTGNFNAHLRDCVFLFADEAFFAGDRQHVGVLKSIITEPYLTIEGKYQNAIQTPNFLHLMMASNEQWVVPASLEARRFLVLEVGADRKDDHAYFAAIWSEMEDGGYEAMLYDLQRFDLAAFNVRRVPVTEGLQDQKKLSLDTDRSWWLDVLHRGYVFRSRLGLDEHFQQWHEQVTTELLFASYTDFAERKHERHTLSRERFGRFMISVGAQPTKPRNQVVGEHVTDVVTAYGTTRKAALIYHQRPPSYELGSLEHARGHFAARTNLPIEWPVAGDDND